MMFARFLKSADALPAMIGLCLMIQVVAYHPSVEAAANMEQTAGHPGPFEMTRKVEKQVSVRYLLRLPDDYENDTEKRWPLILFLHGAGERGTDVSSIQNLGPLRYAEKHADFPFIVAAPQCPLHQDWSPDALNALIDEIQEKYRVDTDRIYLTGFSMGGWGTWELAMESEQRFAAIAPLCGRVVPLLCGRLWKMPAWVFHGEKDDVVPIENSKEIVGYLQEMGNGQCKLTIYPGADHNIWHRTYDNPELYTWLLKHRLSDRQPPKTESKPESAPVTSPQNDQDAP